MKRHLRIAIEAGEHTCRATPNHPWCPFARVSPCRSYYTCHLYGRPLPEVNRDGTPADGVAWPGRLPECKAAEFDAREGANEPGTDEVRQLR